MENRVAGGEASKHIQRGELEDDLEAALAGALARAADAGRFDLVAQLARELEARRLARASNVVSLDTRLRDRS